MISSSFNKVFSYLYVTSNSVLDLVIAWDMVAMRADLGNQAE